MTIKNTLRIAALMLSFAVMSVAFARSDVHDGNAIVKPVKGDKFSIDGAVMGKAELYGYMGDLRDREQFSGIVLKRGGTDEQRQVIGSIARTLGLKAFEDDGGLKPIDLPQAAPTPAAPPIENKDDATPPAQ